MYYVYLLKSLKDLGYYIGVTSDLRARFKEHNTGRSRATAHRRPFILVYYEAYRSKSDALKREKRLKQFKNGYRELLKRVEQSVQSRSGGGRKVRAPAS